MFTCNNSKVKLLNSHMLENIIVRKVSGKK